MNFQKWLTSNYDRDELETMANHGCSGGVSGMIYYDECKKLYAEYAGDIHEIIEEYCDATGEDYPEYIAKELGDFGGFACAALWFAAEWVAREVIEGDEMPTDESRSYGSHLNERI